MPRIAKKSGAYHHGDLRRALLDAAVRVIDKEGLDALTLAALAKKAGVSSGAPYHHFESREALLTEIAVEGFALLATAMKEAAAAAEQRSEGKRSVARFRGIGEGYMRFALSNPGHFRIMFRPEVKATVDAAVRDEAFELVTNAITFCQEEGSLPPGDPRPMILLAWSTVHGASTLWLDGPLADESLVESPDALVSTVADTLVGLLRM